MNEFLPKNSSHHVRSFDCSNDKEPANRPLSSNENLTPREREALAFLIPLSRDYPSIESWYRTKVVPGLRTESRKMICIERDGQIVGLGIAKIDGHERKICTVRVAPRFVGRGIGVRLFDGLLRWLDVDKPHLTVSKARLPNFERIFDWYGFSQTSHEEGRYVPNSVELAYNDLELPQRPSTR